MKVKIAAQTFSNSVASSMEYLKNDLELESFKDLGETIHFCRLVNNLFDILNSRTVFCCYSYKKTLSRNTEEIFFELFCATKEYFANLYLENIPILNSSRKTGFIGFLVAIESFQQIYLDYVKNNNSLKYLLGYKFSQDHIETFLAQLEVVTVLIIIQLRDSLKLHIKDY